MNLFDLVLSNLRRRKGKLALSTCGLAIGVGTVVALHLIISSIEREVAAQLDQYGANIVVVPKIDTQEVSYGGVNVSAATFDVSLLRGDDIAKIKGIEYSGRLSTIAPKLLGSAKVGDQRVTLAGVDFAQELKMKRWWQVVGAVPKSQGEFLIGYDIGRRLGLIDQPIPVTPVAHEHHESDTSAANLKLAQNVVTINGAEFRVAGVLKETGGQDDRMIYCDLPDAQRLLGKPGELSLIELSALCNGCPIDDIVSQIKTVLPNAKVAAVQQAVKARMQTADQLSRFRTSLTVVMAFVGYLVVFVTMMGSVVERTREIGVLKALGFRKRHVVKVFLIEAAFISVTGGAVGWVLGTLFGILSARHFVETPSWIHPSGVVALSAIAAAVTVGTASSLYPAIKASRLDPTESLRYF